MVCKDEFCRPDFNHPCDKCKAKDDSLDKKLWPEYHGTDMCAYAEDIFGKGLV